jgi:hypothetical protein
MKDKTLVSQFKSTDGDVITTYEVDKRHIVEIDVNLNKTAQQLAEEPKFVPTVSRKTKEQRMARIKELLAIHKNRTEIKDTMYKEDYYLHNPNPASAFAGDWNTIHNAPI